MPAGSTTSPWKLTLLGRWQLQHRREIVKVAPRQQCLIAALALHGHRSRAFLANLLWGDSPQTQAMGNLRSSVWHIRRHLPGLLVDRDGTLGLSEDVVADVQELGHSVRSLSERTDGELRTILDSLAPDDLLPGWHDDWVLSERDKLRQAQVKAFESLAEEFIARDAPIPAVDAAEAAVCADPLRETAHRLLARGHIANGDLRTAARTYQRFRQLCIRDFGLEPSDRFARLIEGAGLRTLERAS